jgi:hypothetical protein
MPVVVLQVLTIVGMLFLLNTVIPTGTLLYPIIAGIWKKHRVQKQLGTGGKYK